MFIGSGANKKEKKVALKLVQHIKNHDMTDYSSVIDEEEIGEFIFLFYLLKLENHNDK